MLNARKLAKDRQDFGLTQQSSGFKVHEFCKERLELISTLDHIGYKYHKPLADLYLRFMAANIRHSKGEFAGKPFVPLPWQKELLRKIFGTVNSRGIRLYKRFLCYISKKNGKSTMAAAIGCTLLCEEKGAEVYSCATTKDQASIVHGEAIRMVENSPELNDVCKINRTTKVITLPGTQSYYRALTSEPGSCEGINPNCLVCDELHVWKGHQLWQSLMYGMAARENGLLCVISTAGVYDPESVGHQQYLHAKAILSGEVTEPSTLAFVAEAEEDDDWSSPAVWEKANPSWGTCIHLEEMQRAYDEAVRIPRYESAFRRYRLNQWVSSEETWIPTALWEACQGPIPLEDLEGRFCYAGLDLASERDLAALVLLFPGEHIYCLPFLWTPQKGLERRERLLRVPLVTWAKHGHLHLMPGSRIDQRLVKDKIRSLAETYQIQEVAFDPWNCAQLAVEIEEELHIDAVKFPQKSTHYNEPMKYAEKLILEKRLIHSGNPVLRWNLASITPVTDAADHTMPTRSSAAVKIDGFVALLMALSRLMLSDNRGSVYDREELTIL